ncbi:MAG: radical SAM family heme chaperone HemW [Pseudomonadota bacterium]|nr:radical SAM family heme chaperone HemW [Pseudomonadota bacterium]|tara:strand:- start:311 stop:1471 length:1161 start_codon:yes stop_codon:yes gene_type:complete
MQTFHQAPPLSLYIHLPWCLKKCPYCDFNSHEVPASGFEEKLYINALINDLKFELNRIEGRKIVSIFFGGGTPSLFLPESIEQLLNSIQAQLNFDLDIEITLEANPGAVEAKKFHEYKAMGINRLSLGIQSFNDQSLTLLGRIHNANEAKKAIELSREAGFENFNLDLMFGLPNQKIDDVLTDLKQAVDYSPTHISWYQLTIEPNTIFGSKPPKLPSDDVIWSMQEKGQVFLKKNDFEQYEVSAYAKDNYRSIHNINYWQFGDYLGIGAGSHGKITSIINSQIERYVRHKIPARYIELVDLKNSITEKKVLETKEVPLEFMMNALRLTDGVTENLFFERTGLPIKTIEKELMIAKNRNLLDYHNKRIKPSFRGHRYLNDLLHVFMK